MQTTKRNMIMELQGILSKTSLDACFVSVLPEFGLTWHEVSAAVRSSRLPMTSANVAKTLCQHVINTYTANEVENIIGKLRLNLITTQNRNWHVYNLVSPANDVPISEIIETLPERIVDALMNKNFKNRVPELQVKMYGDLMFFSVQLSSKVKQGSVKYFATPPGQPVLLAASTVSSPILKACAQALGFSGYEKANLYGKDILSLLRIANGSWTSEAAHLTSLPVYNPLPIVTKNCIDFTNKTYDLDYVESILGPNPPLLTELTVTSSKPFFDETKLKKDIKIKMHLKCENVANTLKSWVAIGAIAPTSDWFSLFHNTKSNRIEYNNDQDE